MFVSQGNQEKRKRTRQRETASQMDSSGGHKQTQAYRPKFFKLFRPASSSHQLSIPHDFVRHFNGRIPEKVYFIDGARKYWCVQLEEIGGHMLFTNGWERFKRAHFLNFGDFLVFQYNRRSLFEVEIFDRRGCMKEEPIDISESTPAEDKLEQDYTAEQGEAGDSSEASGPKSTNLEKSNTPAVVAGLVASKTPHFVLSISRCTLATVYIHKSVVKAFNIALKPKTVLRDQNGQAWPVRIIFKEDGRIAIGSGWSYFANNNVKVEDQCVFEFVLQRGNTCEEIRVHVLRGNARMKKPSSHWHWHRQC
ncbi:putative B3 domain-containing protein Os03g0621600 [Corylus avellana]|uniref:putative B3 domain-containing protein Os03g0621600 n=1 Tax=Corylus avellana TaxID=13451 RepID=UPI00286BA698|nr:putative B3 domain-containing protein Os03g0621600 [Corylus avellana]